MSDPHGARSRILFVDDEERVVSGLRRMLRGYRDRWDMTFLTSPEEALEVALESAFDVVVADMRMPGMTGAELLERIRDRHAGTVRIILSGHSEVSSIMRSVGPSHQFLSKPCDGATLQAAVDRACFLRAHLAQPRLLEMVGGLEKLPSLPSVYSDLVRAIQEEASMAEIGQIISQDVAMTATVLKLVNSSYFGVSREIVEPAKAALMLGVETLQALVLGVKIFDQAAAGVVQDSELEELCARSNCAAACAREICRIERADDVLTAQTAIAAFLHDIGALILTTQLPGYAEDVAARAGEAGMSEVDAEREVVGATHGDVGGYLTSLWGFPDPIVAAVTFHHRPLLAGDVDLTPLSIVHLAQAVASAAVAGREDAGDGLPEGLCCEYYARTGLSEKLPKWVEACRKVQDRK